MFEPKESVTTNNILKYLNSLPLTWAFKVHGNAYQQSGIPDIVGCMNGRFFAFEVKRPGGKMSPLQEYRCAEIAKANGLAKKVTSVDEVKKILESW